MYSFYKKIIYILKKKIVYIYIYVYIYDLFDKYFGMCAIANDELQKIELSHVLNYFTITH